MTNELSRMLAIIPKCNDWALTDALVTINAADHSRLKPEAADALTTLRAHIIAEMGSRVARAYVEAHGALMH